MADVYINTSNVLQVTGLTDQVKSEYVNDATVTARLYDLTDRRHLDRAAAVDHGDGTVGLPCMGHGLAGGDQILVCGAPDYNGSYTLAVPTTSNILVVTATYAAFTFAGDEFVLPGVGSSMTLAYVASSNGNYRGTLPAATALKLIEDHDYWLIITAVDTSGAQTVFRSELTAVYATGS